MNAADLKFLQDHTARLHGLTSGHSLEDADDSGCRIGTFMGFRVYLADKIGEDEGGGDVFASVEFRSTEGAPEAWREFEDLDEVSTPSDLVTLYLEAVGAVAGHVAATNGSYWNVDRADAAQELLGDDGWTGLGDDLGDRRDEPSTLDWELLHAAVEAAWDAAREAGIISACKVEPNGLGGFLITAPFGSDWAVRESLAPEFRIVKVADVRERDAVDFDVDIEVHVEVDVGLWLDAHPTLVRGDSVTAAELLAEAPAESWQELPVVAEAIADAINDLADDRS